MQHKEDLPANRHYNVWNSLFRGLLKLILYQIETKNFNNEQRSNIKENWKSKLTVSKSLNNDKSINPLTKERVKELAKELNYVANESARYFRLNKSFTVGLIIPNLLDQFYVLAINGIEEIASKENYRIFLAQSHEDVAGEENVVNAMMRNRDILITHQRIS